MSDIYAQKSGYVVPYTSDNLANFPPNIEEYSTVLIGIAEAHRVQP